MQTDNGHEFQAKFHWHVEDLGIRHVYIRPGTPRLNGKVERSHGTDKEEFYQMIEYKNDVDLEKMAFICAEIGSSLNFAESSVLGTDVSCSSSPRA